MITTKNQAQLIYRQRFKKYLLSRNQIYQILCQKFFQSYISPNSVVLDIGAGYGEFINHIQAKEKIALDINPDLKKFVHSDVKTLICSSIQIKSIANQSIDVIFVSNFFEHLDKPSIIKTIKEIRRVLKPKGKLLILQPNFRYCYKDYWMFFDHITPLDDRSLTEILTLNHFQILELKPKFLPYTVKSKIPKSIILLKIYLKLPFIQRIFGKQVFIYARKT